MTDKPQFVSEVAKSYLCGESVAIKPDIRRAYRLMNTVNSQLFEQIPVPVIFQSEDPYDNYQDMAATVEFENTLRIWNGGSPVEYMTTEQNLKARAVHDWFGHLSLKCDFSIEGEVTKWANACKHYPDVCHQMLFAEVVGQVCTVHYQGWDYEQKPVASPPRHLLAVCQHYGIDLPNGWNYHTN